MTSLQQIENLEELLVDAQEELLYRDELLSQSANQLEETEGELASVQQELQQSQEEQYRLIQRLRVLCMSQEHAFSPLSNEILNLLDF